MLKMSKKKFRKYMRNTDGKVFNDRFYKENGGLKKFSNPNRDPQVAIKYSVNHAVNLYKTLKSMGKPMMLTIPNNSEINQQVYKQLTDKGIPTELVSTADYKKNTITSLKYKRIANVLFEAIKRLLFLYESDENNSSYNMTEKAYNRDDIIETKLFKDLCLLLKDKSFIRSFLLYNHAKLIINPNTQNEEKQLNMLDAIEYTWDMTTSFQDDYQIVDDEKVYKLLGITSEKINGSQMYKFDMHKRSERPNSEYSLTLMALLYDIYRSLSITSDMDNGNYTNLNKIMMSAPYIISINK